MQDIETADAQFSRSFSFAIDGGLTKTVTVQRAGRRFRIHSLFSDGESIDETEDSFEADGTVTFSLTDAGLYITSGRSLLLDRIRLKRTRFF